jgi:hypothetical protein
MKKMVTRKVIMLTMLTMCAITVTAQEQTKLTVNSNGDYVVLPQREEYMRRRLELLKNPDFLKLKLAPVDSKHGEEAEERAEEFKAGKKIRLQLLMTNTLSEPFIVEVGSYHHNTRPLLIRGGQTLPYHKEAIKLVENKERIFNRVYGLSVTLNPGDTHQVGTIDLSKWYEPIEPGRYLLTIQYRLLGSEKWIESPPITFEVVPH